MSAENACIFCMIVAGEAPAHKVYENDRLLIFMDLFPVSPGHTLIIPKAHGKDLFEVEPGDLQAMIAHSKPLAEAIREVFSPDGIAVVQLNGAAAGQTVFHYHMHLIPRMEGDPPGGLHGKKQAEASVLAERASKLAEVFVPPA